MNYTYKAMRDFAKQLSQELGLEMGGVKRCGKSQSCYIGEDITAIDERHNMIFAGCSVMSGSCKAVVTETGDATEIGKILEARAINKTRKSITRLMDIKPEYANIKLE